MSQKNSIMAMLALFLCIVATATYSVVQSNQQPRIAYVRSAELVNQYQGMTDARQQFQLTTSRWEANVDTLEMDYKRTINSYEQAYARLTSNERNEHVEMIRHQEQNLARYSESIQNRSAEEEEKLLIGVLNQVNAFVEQYASTQGYDLVLGTTLSGSILYGTDAIDITDEVLQALNQQYNGSHEQAQ